MSPLKASHRLLGRSSGARQKHRLGCSWKLARVLDSIIGIALADIRVATAILGEQGGEFCEL